MSLPFGVFAPRALVGAHVGRLAEMRWVWGSSLMKTAVGYGNGHIRGMC